MVLRIGEKYQYVTRRKITLQFYTAVDKNRTEQTNLIETEFETQFRISELMLYLEQFQQQNATFI